ncbi:S26 family signal peptidase [Sphingomonas gilva]|uniref:S26 family signal peptidase n=1 Tax=Sphingomonas gilva TaxID=2305907 RepID=A0A396RQF8_9SPHN|nr:S26 family signal peptidase [Sphingomonas gilva]RHW18186.1 S26 family signal peptidase [Sphingomonas gilva]
MSWRSHRPADVPLFDWGDALRRARIARRQLRRRAAAIALGTALLGVTIVAPPAPRFVWNASASAPIGLYRVMLGAAVERGDMVVAWVPKPFRRLAAARRYLPENVPLVKRVAAVAGDEVCARGKFISVGGRMVAVRRTSDGRGRIMPQWTGCRILRAEELLLLIDGSPDSFDGRYFGVTGRDDIIGKARLIWTRPKDASDA